MYRHFLEDDVCMVVMVSAIGMGGGSGSYVLETCHPGPMVQRRLSYSASIMDKALGLGCQ